MKKTYKVLLIAIMVLIVTCALWACKDDDVEIVTYLSKPVNIAASGSTISWDAVDGASKYEIIVDSAEAKETESTYYQLDISQIGSYQIKVRAVGVNVKGVTIYSEYTEYTFVKSNKLTTPVVNVVDKSASWAAVTNAVEYQVKVLNSSGSELYSTTQSELAISLDDEKYAAVGKYTISVKAIPEASKPEYANSDTGIGYYIVTSKLATPSISSVSTTAIRWSSISGITGYRVMLYNASTNTLIETYSTTSNSYAFSSMAMQDEGKYYCLIQAVGDGEVYLDSDISSRQSDYDLNVVSTLIEDSVELVYNAVDGWVLNFQTNNVDLLSSFTISLKTTKADSSSSMPTIEKTVWKDDGTIVYNLSSDAYNENTKYYTKQAAGYVKNTKPYDSTKTYYIFDGATYTQQPVASLSQTVEYFLYYDEDYYEAALGAPVYTLVDITSSTFSTREEYFTFDGTNYNLVTSTYEETGDYDTLPDGDTIYLKKDGDTYIKLGTKAEITETGLAHYYVYHPFTSFETGVEYYQASYATFGDSDYSVDTFYVVSSASYSLSIDGEFFTKDGDNYTYKKSDIAYYGKTYSISIEAQGIQNTTITGDSVTCDDQYTSYRCPNKVDSSIAYAESSLKSYFDTEEEYAAFVTKYDGYYTVESLGDLQYITYALDSKYVQMQDLDAQGYYWRSLAGVDASAFTGVYDGNNHLISDIVYKAPIFESIYQGLFAEVSGATITDVYIVNASNYEVPFAVLGGLVGKITDSATIARVYVQGTFSNGEYIGGIAGSAYSTGSMSIKITQTQADVEISNALHAAGIIAGCDYVGELEISGSIAIGSLTIGDNYFLIGDHDALDSAKEKLVYKIESNTKIYVYENEAYRYVGDWSDRDTDAFKNGDDWYSSYYIRILGDDGLDAAVGGLIGNILNVDTSSIVSDSVAEVEIKVSLTDNDVYAGGLIGIACDTTITNCRSGSKFTFNAPDIMTLSAGGNNTYVGGLVGLFRDSNVYKSYSTIKVSGRDNFGGLIGETDGTCEVKGCYTTGGVSQQTAEHKSPFIAVIGVSTTCEDNYVYNSNSDLILSDAIVTNDFAVIKDGINEYETNTAAIIIGTDINWLEPAIQGMLYIAKYSKNLKPSEDLNVEVYMVDLDGSIVNIYEDGLEINIGDRKSKGTALVILQQKVDEDDDGVDDNTGLRVVIYVTIA